MINRSITAIDFGRCDCIMAVENGCITAVVINYQVACSGGCHVNIAVLGVTVAATKVFDLTCISSRVRIVPNCIITQFQTEIITSVVAIPGCSACHVYIHRAFGITSPVSTIGHKDVDIT